MKTKIIKILNIIWKFINSKIFMYALLILFILNMCSKNSDLKRENLKHEQNIEAADSTIKIYKNKNGTLTAEKTIWILSKKELKKKNNELSDLANNQTGKLISLNNTILRLRQDTSILHDSIRYLTSIIGTPVQINATTWLLPWELRYKWDAKNYDIFKGHTIVEVDTNTYIISHKNTLLDKRDSRIDLTFGEKVNDGKFNVYISSKYPGLTPESMKGVFIDPNTNKDIKSLIEKNHWFTGFGVGPSFGLGYDFIHNQPTIVIGIGIHYNIFQW